jgi:hypothetical protein
MTAVPGRSAIEHVAAIGATTPARAAGAARQTPAMDYLRIWADADGESHLEEVTLPRRVHPAEAGVAELWGSDPLGVAGLSIVTVRAGVQAPDWHCGPQRQFVVFLDGWVRIATSDGDHRELPRGSVVLVEDVHGRGHVTEHQPGDRRVLILPAP